MIFAFGVIQTQMIFCRDFKWDISAHIDKKNNFYSLSFNIAGYIDTEIVYRVLYRNIVIIPARGLIQTLLSNVNAFKANLSSHSPVREGILNVDT